MIENGNIVLYYLVVMPLKWLRRQKIQQNLFQNEFLEVLSFKIINFEFSKFIKFYRDGRSRFQCVTSNVIQQEWPVLG